MLLSSFSKKLLLAFVTANPSLFVCAQVTLPKCFSDNMVLQREKPIPVWGEAAPGEKIAIGFAGKTYNTVANSSGQWKVQLKKQKASATAQQLSINASNHIVLNNVLIGDVWLCGGQSNMEYPMDRRLHKYAAPSKGADSAALELARPDKTDAIRYMYVQKNLKLPKGLPTIGWVTASDTMLRYITAAGYFFAKEVYEKTGIPIGIIHDNWGGTRIEPWTPAEAYQQSSFFAAQATSDTFKIDGAAPGQQYNKMIAPLMPYALKGILWYQGESNCMIDDQASYPEKFAVWLNSWRKGFNDKKLPVYYVQVSPHLYTKRKTNRPIKGPESLPLTWEAQAKSLKLAHTGMIVTTDLVDNLSDIHPSYKWTVGHRLALQALAQTYAQKGFEYSGPVYKSMKVKGNTIELHFTHTGSGLASNDGQALNWFTIAGADGIFVPATATIVNNQLIVSASAVAHPTQIRFAWHETAQPNFINKEGLPAQPFRTRE